MQTLQKLLPLGEHHQMAIKRVLPIAIHASFRSTFFALSNISLRKAKNGGAEAKVMADSPILSHNI